MRSSRTRYEPKDSPELDAGDPAEIEYAAAFQDVAAMADSPLFRTTSELLMLRLSTCRNAYLTANALFVQLRLVLGHGQYPSPLARAIKHVERREPELAKRHLDEVRALVDSFDQKCAAWDRRAELDDLVEKYAKSLRPVQRDRLRTTIELVRTQSPDGAAWDGKYYAVSSSEPAHVAEALVKLRRARDWVNAIVDGARVLSETTAPALQLFADLPAAKWASTVAWLRSAGPMLGIDVRDHAVLWRDAAEQSVTVPTTYPGEADAVASIGAVLALLDREVPRLYDDLATAFRANVAVPPLPRPFVIDLTDPPPAVVAAVSSIRVAMRPFNANRPDMIRVAWLNCGVPLSYFNRSTLRYGDDAIRERVTALAMTAVNTAAEQGVQLVVFPEYFLPRNAIDPIGKLALQRGMVVVSGAEGRVAPADGRLVNAAVVMVPPLAQPIEQRKQRPATVEPELEPDGIISVFSGTPIGNFAVLVCSDYLELDLVGAIAAAPTLIDLLIVPTFNDQIDLFQTLAASDAYRLYCHVLVANNFTGERPEQSSSRGSLACCPAKLLAQRTAVPTREVPLISVPEVGGNKPAVLLLDISLAELGRGHAKPSGMFLTAPRCRGRPG